ncbi:MAG TPA: tyrosine--tRNA ligase [Thermodesulfobacteriota bacterium]|nr:tyrosine--tRNA ligase [Thermodesulfobacteriota bacterium]
MQNYYQTLKERGFIEQVTDPEEMETLFGGEPVIAYIGFDPTAESLHVGSLIPIMALAHLQRHGHRPIALVGGGTALIGDPSGKKEMRPVLTHEQIRHNAEGLKKQLSRYMTLDNSRGFLLNNIDWLAPLNYIEFLRDIGRHFSVNRMLTAESVRQRLETGLSFIEFNYQLLQAYDFLYLYSHEHCLLQMGGADQWGNIVAGTDLIRRVRGGKAYGLTFPLIVTSSGEKMGKTAKGAVWLDPERTSPYEYYQFWINTDDRDVGRFLALFTYLPMERVRELSEKEGAELREVKEVLALEATAITHGREAAEQAKETSRNLFYGGGAQGETVPTATIDREKLIQGVEVYLLLVEAGLCQSRGEARRLIAQGGVTLNDSRIQSFDQKISLSDLKENALLLKIGKKRYKKVSVR